MNSCCINRLSELTCVTPTGKSIWFKCRYSSCHGGVGHVVVTASDGSVLYDGDPTTATSKYVYIDLDTAKLNTLGGTMDVTYKPGDRAWGGHTCSRATFDWGYAGNEQLVVGTAYLDNTGGQNDLGNTCATGSSQTRCNTFQIPIGSLTSTTQGTTLPNGFYAKTRNVCFISRPTCTTWIEAVTAPKRGINFLPAGSKLATIPAGKSLLLALINYATLGVANTAPGAELNVTSGGQILSTIPISLGSNGSPISPYPFDGISVDGLPLKITNTWGLPVDLEVGTGLVNFPGIYNGLAGIRVDDSLAYIIS